MRKGIIVNVTSAERARIRAVVTNRNSPQKHVWRANIILLTADGLGTNAIMRGTGRAKSVVWRWQERFMREASTACCATRPARRAASHSTCRSSSGYRPDGGRSARGNDALDRWPDGPDGRHQRLFGAADLAGARAATAPGAPVQAVEGPGVRPQNCAKSSAFTSTRRPTPLCSRSTRSRRYRRSIAPSPGCR